MRLDIDDIAAGGDGIARADDGRVVFVTGGIPGDTVDVEVTKAKAKRLHARVVTVVESSVDRVAPPCPHVAQGCGGCGWQHIELTAQRRLKVRLAEESLRRIGRTPGVVELGPPLPAVGFRTTVRCAVDSSGRAGFRAARSHDVVVPESCLVAHPAIQEVMATGLFPGSSEVVIRTSASTGERVVRVDGPVDHVDVPDGVVAVGSGAAPGVGAITEVVAGAQFRVSPASFFQTRTDGAAALVDAVRRAVGEVRSGERLVDLYGGVGLFAATVGADYDTTLVEASRSSIADARANLPDSKVVRAQVERWRPSSADVVVADPPRAGLGARAVDVIAATGARRVVVVHCDAASFGRDVGLLRTAGWSRSSSALIDLFPHTPHVELVSAFTGD